MCGLWARVCAKLVPAASRMFAEGSGGGERRSCLNMFSEGCESPEMNGCRAFERLNGCGGFWRQEGSSGGVMGIS